MTTSLATRKADGERRAEEFRSIMRKHGVGKAP